MQSDWSCKNSRILKNAAGSIQQLEKLARDVQPLSILCVRFSNDVGNKGTRRLQQLAVELSGNFVGQKPPECKIGASQQYPDHGSEQQHHSKMKRFRFHDSGTPRR